VAGEYLFRDAVGSVVYLRSIVCWFFFSFFLIRKLPMRLLDYQSQLTSLQLSDSYPATGLPIHNYDAGVLVTHFGFVSTVGSEPGFGTMTWASDSSSKHRLLVHLPTGPRAIYFTPQLPRGLQSSLHSLALCGPGCIADCWHAGM
jgi:hypothetical protein